MRVRGKIGDKNLAGGKKQSNMQLILTENQQQILTEFARSTPMPHAEVVRAKIILQRSAGQSNSSIVKKIGCHRNTVTKWCRRWHDKQAMLAETEKEASPQAYRKIIKTALMDEERTGRPNTFTAEQLCQIMAVACQPPEELGYPVSHWTPQELALEIVKQNIVERISIRHIGRFLKGVPVETASVPILANE